jgi:CheY-like chemotaxis protein
MEDHHPVADVGVLVIDDHPSFRAAARALLKATPGFAEVAEAGTGREGIALAEDMHPDFALLDVDLPDMTGFETCDRMREISPETYVVFISANEDAGIGIPECCAEQPFVAKRDLRPALLRRLWDARPSR